MATKNAKPVPVSIYQLLQSANPSTVNVKLISGDLFTDAQVLNIATNGIQIFDTTANLVRFIPEWATAYISVAAPASS